MTSDLQKICKGSTENHTGLCWSLPLTVQQFFPALRPVTPPWQRETNYSGSIYTKESGRGYISEFLFVCFPESHLLSIFQHNTAQV